MSAKVFFDVFACEDTDTGRLFFNVHRIEVPINPRTGKPERSKQTDEVIGEIDADNAARLVDSLSESLRLYLRDLERKVYGE